MSPELKEKADLHLLLEIGGFQYAIPSSRVAAVTPYVELRPLATAVKGIAGVMNFRSQATPVIDLARAIDLPAVPLAYSSRIVVVNVEERLLGLLAENILETVRVSRTEFQETGVSLPEAPFLGPVWMRGERPVQRIDPILVLPPLVRESLFQELDRSKK